MQHPSDISILDFTYDLPQEKIATYPLSKRDESKLLVYKSGEIQESVFKNIGTFLAKGTLLVFNTTKVVRARLNFLNEKAQAIEIFCLEPDSSDTELSQAMATKSNIRWTCLVGNLKRWKEEELKLVNSEVTLTARILEKKDLAVKVHFSWTPQELCFSEVLERLGNIPIPPYLKRTSEATDQERYQTVYARDEGSVAAPTAGLHFTPEVITRLEQQTVSSLSLTLHVGAGTFKPVKSETLRDHEMHAEWMDVSAEAIEQLSNHSQEQIIAVGTTSLRTLESLYWMGVKAFLNKEATVQEIEIKQWDAYELEDQDLSMKQSLEALLVWMKAQKLSRLVCHTQILIAPPYQLRVAQGIVTNFHQPNSTLLLLIAAIVGNKWKEIYQHALDHDFRFLSYGDSSLLLK